MRMYFVLPVLGAAVFAATPQVVAQPAPTLLKATLRPHSEAIRAVDHALFEASAAGDLDRIESLLEDGADADAVLSGDGSPLIAAARNGHVSAVDRLLDAGADPNLGVPGDGTPLTNASAYGRDEVVRQLVRAGALGSGRPDAENERVFVRPGTPIPPSLDSTNDANRVWLPILRAINWSTEILLV